MQNQDHLGGCFNPDPVLIVPDVWEKLIETYKPQSVLDVGCGYGHATKWFFDKGISVIGIEAYGPALRDSACPDRITAFDFTRPGILSLADFDLCWCCEFVEHVEAQHMPKIMAAFRRCKVVAMTHAVPGQGGFHHVNEQPAEYWVGAMAAIGFTLDKTNTERIRRPAPYGVNNLLIFTKNA